MAFLTAFFTVLGEHVATIIAGALILGGAYVGLSPRGRLIIKSVRNYITSNASNNPKIAAGMYDEKLKELREQQKKVVELQEKSSASLLKVNEKEQIARREFQQYSLKAKRLESKGTPESHQQALTLASQARKALMRADDYKAAIPKLQATVDAVKDRFKEIEEAISDLTARKEKTINEIERGKLEREISEELQGLNISAIDASIAEVEKYADEQKYLGVGARIAYENSDKKMLKDAAEAADYGDAEDFLRGIMESND